MSTPIVEGRHFGEFIMAEANGNRSREVAKVTAAVAVLVGAVLVRTEVAASATVGTVGVTGGNTGNGVLTKANPAFGPNVDEGTYKVMFTDENTNLGDFVVTRPNGTIDGWGRVGTAYVGEVRFTIADGATDFIAGDSFTLPVVIDDSASEYNIMDPTNIGNAPMAIAMYPLAAADTYRKITVIARSCQVNQNCIEWPVGITAQQKSDAINYMTERQGIVFR